jgi:hypothetical protein
MANDEVVGPIGDAGKGKEVDITPSMQRFWRYRGATIPSYPGWW